MAQHMARVRYGADMLSGKSQPANKFAAIFFLIVTPDRRILLSPPPLGGRWAE